MKILAIIALAEQLLKVGQSAYDSFGKIVAALQQNKEWTAEERAAFEALMKLDAAQPYAQQQPE